MIRVYASSVRPMEEEEVEVDCERREPAGSTSETIAPHRAAPRQFIEAVYRFSKNLCGHPRPGARPGSTPIRAFSYWVSHGKGPINEPRLLAECSRRRTHSLRWDTWIRRQDPVNCRPISGLRGQTPAACRYADCVCERSQGKEIGNVFEQARIHGAWSRVHHGGECWGISGPSGERELNGNTRRTPARFTTTHRIGRGMSSDSGTRGSGNRSHRRSDAAGGESRCGFGAGKTAAACRRAHARGEDRTGADVRN